MIYHGRKIYINSKILNTTEIDANPAADLPIAHPLVTPKTSTLFQINSTKLYVPVVILSISNNINFSENLKQGYKRAISQNKYRYEILTQSKNNNLDYMIDPTFGNTNRLFAQSFKAGNNDPTIESFDKYYMPLVETNRFNVLINNKPF